MDFININKVNINYERYPLINDNQNFEPDQ